MTTLTETLAAPPVRRTRPWRLRLWPALAALLAGWRQHRRHRRALEELTRLDDRLLRDIGIEPGDLYGALAGLRGAPDLLSLSPLHRRSDGAP